MKTTRTMPLSELRELVAQDEWSKVRVSARWLLSLVEERNRLRGTPDANLDVDLGSKPWVTGCFSNEDGSVG